MKHPAYIRHFGHKELINKLPRDIILIISKMHPLLIPPFTNKGRKGRAAKNSVLTSGVKQLKGEWRKTH